MTDRIVIVGGGLVAARTIRAYRDAGGDAPVTVISADTALPYNRPPLSKGFLRGEIEVEAVFVEPEDAYSELGIDVRLETTATGVDTERRLVALEGVGEIEYGRVVPDIHAAGDVASFYDPVFGHRRLIQHWTNANHHGQRLGRLLAGEDAPYDLVAYFFSEVFGTKLGLLGDLEAGHDELVVRGSLEEGSVAVFYLRDSRLVAALVSGPPAAAQSEIDGLLRRRAVVLDRAALEDADTALQEAFLPVPLASPTR